MKRVLVYYFLFIILLASCKKKGGQLTECERVGGDWTYYDCSDTTTLEWVGGVCGWSPVYCEGAMPIAVTRTSCKQHCRFPDKAPKRQAEWTP